jgi:hypothetical protein
MVKVYTNGKMVGNMWVVMSMIRKVGLVNIIGMMEGYLKVYGRMVRETAKD